MPLMLFAFFIITLPGHASVLRHEEHVEALAQLDALHAEVLFEEQVWMLKTIPSGWGRMLHLAGGA